MTPGENEFDTLCLNQNLRGGPGKSELRNAMPQGFAQSVGTERGTLPCLAEGQGHQMGPPVPWHPCRPFLPLQCRAQGRIFLENFRRISRSGSVSNTHLLHAFFFFFYKFITFITLCVFVINAQFENVREHRNLKKK